MTSLEQKPLDSEAEMTSLELDMTSEAADREWAGSAEMVGWWEHGPSRVCQSRRRGSMISLEC